MTKPFSANLFLSKIDKLILQLPFTEFHTGFRIYGKQFNKMPYEKFSDDYLLSFEVIAFAAFMKFKSAEVPVECDYIDDHTSHSYIGASIYAIQHFLTLFCDPIFVFITIILNTILNIFFSLFRFAATLPSNVPAPRRRRP